MKYFTTIRAVFALLLFSAVQVIAQPNLSAPPSGANYVTTTPTLYWWYVTTSTETYTVQIATDAAFTSIVHSAGVSGGGAASYTVPSSTLSSGVTYYWRVGVGGSFSAPWTLIPNGNTFGGGGAPMLSAPPDGSTFGIGTSVTLYWYYITTGTPTYTVEVSLASDFSSIFYTTTTTSVSATVSGLSFGVAYYWRVKADGKTSTSWTFTPTSSTYTSDIFLTHPGDGFTNIPTTQSFFWYGGTAPYTLEISTSSDFSSGVSSYPGVAIGHEVSGLLTGTNYYWRVSDGSFTTAAWSFTTTGTPAPLYDWYVDIDNLNPTPDGSLGNPFTLIQDAIDASSTGQSIFVYTGSYTENLTIDEEVTIKGDGCDSVTVTGSHTITASNVSITGINFVTSGTAITISTAANAIDSVDITYSCFTLPSPGIGVYLGGGSPAFKLSDVNISYNEFNGPVDMISNPIKVGGAFGSPIGLELEGLLVTYNTFDRGSIPINLYDEDLTNLEFQYNTFTNTDGALYIWNNALAPTGVLSDFLFKHNTIDGTNSYGIAFGIPGINNLTDANWGSSIQVTHCNFGAIPGAYGIGAIGVEGATTFVLDAELNWWETTSGPTHSGNTYTNPDGDPQGASVSDNVDYVPWLSQSHMGVGPVFSFAPVTNPLGGKYSSIQAAIEDAAPNNNINAADGTFTEDLTIATNGLNISGTGYSSTTTLKGVVTHTLGPQPGAGFPTAYPNIHILADNVKIHGFIIESPDVAPGFYSSGLVFTGTGHEFYENNFHSVISSSVNTVDPNVDNQGNGYAIAIQSYYTTTAPAPYTSVEDISGLKIYDNIFTSTATGTGTPSYEAIFLNYDSNTSGVEITDNALSGNIYRGIATMVDDLTIENNSIVTDIASMREAIWILEGDNVIVTKNTISGFSGTGTIGDGSALEIGGGWGLARLESFSATYNDFSGCERGVSLIVDFSSVTVTTMPVFNYNSFYGNVSGMRVDGSTGDGITYVVDAENNWWGSEDGPSDATSNVAPVEVVTGVAPVADTQFWVNLIAENTGTLGNSVVDRAAAVVSGGLFVDYYPWQSGTPVLDVSDATTNIGATVSLPVTVSFLGTPINYTLIGTFSYTTSELDYVSAGYGVGTLINSSGWSVLFYETTPGTVSFVAYGVTTPISTGGVLFNLLFKVIDSGAGTSDVTGNNADFLADGVQLFGASGTFSGTVTYSGTAPAPLKGDADLDGDVDIDDLTLVAKYINGDVSFNSLQVDNADVDGDNDVDADDLSDISYFIAFGTWPPAPSAPSFTGGTVTFANIALDENGLMNFPVLVNNASKVRNFELTINYDEDAVDYQTFSKLISGKYNQVHAVKSGEGEAKFLFASPSSFDGDLVPGSFVMKLKDSFPEGSVISTRIKVNGGEEEAGPSFVFGDGVTSVSGGETEIPDKFMLEQNYPNPFNPSTTIRFGIPEASFVSIKIYDMLGQEIKALVRKEFTAGNYDVVWNGDDNFGNRVASGTYIYRVISGKNVMTKKMVLLK